MESVLHKRYKIGERLFSNELGELFLGRDLKAMHNKPLLIHYLPKQLSDSALKQSLSLLQTVGAQAPTSVLSVLDCAWSDTEVFFVLETPEAWSLSPLPVMQGEPTKLHQKATEITQQLLDQNLINTGLEPCLFMVTPTGELHLLGTAFLSELQELQATLPTLLQPQTLPPKAKKAHFLPLLLLATTGLVAAASLGLYHFKHEELSAMPVAPKAMVVSQWDTPKPNLTAPTELLTTPKLESQSEPALAQVVQVSEPSSSSTSQSSIANTASLTTTPANSPDLAMQSEPSAQTNPLAEQNLAKATEAIKRGHLQTGLYYLRLAKKLGATQVLLKPTAQTLIQNAQQAVIPSEVMSLQMQESIKEEFDL